MGKLRDAVVKLVSGPEKRRRIFSSFAYGQADIDKLALEVATTRVAAYETRLRDAAKGFGITDVRLTDTKVLQRINQDSRAVALDVIRNHNSDLRRFINAIPSDVSQRDMRVRIKEWEGNRAQWKSKQVAMTEAMEGRNQAGQDVYNRNKVKTLVRAVPRGSAHAACADLVNRGWMPTNNAPRLPLHPHCVHSYEQKVDIVKATEGKKSVWLGDTYQRKDDKWVLAK